MPRPEAPLDELPEGFSGTEWAEKTANIRRALKAVHGEPLEFDIEPMPIFQATAATAVSRHG